MALNADARFTPFRLCLYRNCNFIESNTDSDALEMALNNLFLILWRAFCADAGRFIIYTPRDVYTPGIPLNGIPCLQPFSYANNFSDATRRAFDFNVLQHTHFSPRSALCGGHFEIGKKDDTRSLSYWRPISFSIPYSFLRCSHFFLFLNFLAMVEFATGDRVFGRQPRAEHRKPKTCKSPPKILYIIYDCNVYLILLLLNRIISEFEKSMRSERQQQ